MASPDWITIGTIASTVALMMSGFLWLASRIFQLGQTSQRLNSIESDVADLNHRFDRLDQRIDRLDQRMDTLSRRLDKLIFMLAPSPSPHGGHSHTD